MVTNKMEFACNYLVLKNAGAVGHCVLPVPLKQTNRKVRELKKRLLEIAV